MCGNAATPWLCTRAAPSHTSLTRHTRKGEAREMTGRACDGSDSYSCSCMWSVAVYAAQLSAGRTAVLQREEQRGGAAITEKLSEYSEFKSSDANTD